MDEARLPLTEHLAELRTRLFKILIALALGTIACWGLREEIFGFLVGPAIAALDPEGGRLQAIAPTEIFFTYLKCALLAGFVLTLPIFFYQVWAFVAPGLYAREKRVVVPFVVVSTALFVAGAAFGHQIVFPLIYTFFASFESGMVEAAWTLREVFALTVRLFLAFGIGFDLPVIVFFVAASGLVDARTLLRGTRYGVLVAFVLGALLTPPDVVSQVLLAAPLTVLYLIGVGLGWLVARKRKSEAAGEPTRAQGSREPTV